MMYHNFKMIHGDLYKCLWRRWGKVSILIDMELA